MTDDAKRRMVWLCHGCDECDGPRPQVRPCDSPSSTGAWVVLAADFDRLRDERDRAVEAAGVLADALRNNAPCYCDHPLRAGLPPCSRCSALAVFDTLTEEKTDE